MRFTVVTLFIFGLALPSEGSSVAYQVNSVSPTLAVGESETDTINEVVTLADGGIYQIFGTFGSSNTSAGVFSASHDFQVTYEGNASGGLSGAESIVVDLFYSFADGGVSTGTFNRDLIGAFGGGIASTSTGSSCVNVTLGCTGTLTPPGSFSSTSSFQLLSSAGAYSFEPGFSSNFGAGSAVGSYIVWGQTAALTTPPVNSTPEPGSISMMAIGILAACARKCLGRKVSRA